MICGIREANVWHVKLTAIRKALVVQLRKGVAFIHSGLADCGVQVGVRNHLQPFREVLMGNRPGRLIATCVGALYIGSWPLLSSVKVASIFTISCEVVKIESHGCTGVGLLIQLVAYTGHASNAA